MPYVDIDGAERNCLFDIPRAETAGELNYQVTQLVVAYLRNHGLHYQSINDVVGALEGAKAEFQRRVVGPYEDDCIERNGDVYPEGFVNGRPNKDFA